MDRQIPMGDFFFLSILFLLYGPQVVPFFYSFFLSSCTMVRGHEEVLTRQAGRRKCTPWEMPTTSNLVATMFAEELRLYSQIPIETSLETSDDTATSTFGEVDNVVYLTREQLDYLQLQFLEGYPSYAQLN